MHQVGEIPARGIRWPFCSIADRQQTHGVQSCRCAEDLADALFVERADPAGAESACSPDVLS